MFPRMLPDARYDSVRSTKLEYAIYRVSMRQGTRAPEDCVISRIPAYLHIESSTKTMATSRSSDSLLLFTEFYSTNPPFGTQMAEYWVGERVHEAAPTR